MSVRVGVTGHRRLEHAETWDWVRREIRAALREVPRPLMGLTALAIGADQLFAEVVLENGGDIEAIIPFADYESKFDNELDAANYRRLKALAARVEVLADIGSDEEAYMACGRVIADRSDLLLAVWDGEPARGRGGTADVVRHALTTATRVLQLDPKLRRVVCLTN
jgi:hypothetical protein